MPSYWLVDPDALTVTVLELAEGVYREVAVATQEEVVQVLRPFALTIDPARLLD